MYVLNYYGNKKWVSARLQRELKQCQERVRYFQTSILMGTELRIQRDRSPISVAHIPTAIINM